MTEVNVAVPVLSGGGTPPRVGKVFTTSNGQWTFDPAFVLDYTYRWLRCDAAGANCVAIGGATAQSYRMVSADLGATIRAEVTASEVAPPADPPPPPDGQSLDHFNDFANNEFTDIFLNRWAEGGYSSIGYTGSAWPNGGGIFEFTDGTYGDGFRFVMDQTLQRGSGNGVQIVDWDHLVDRQNYLGNTYRLYCHFRLPSAGNPNGFPEFSDWGVLWEYGPGLTSNNQVGIDANANRIYVRSYKAGAQDSRQKGSSAYALQYDHWYTLDWTVKFSTSGTGFVTCILDGETIANWTGPTLPPGIEAPWIQFGFYSGEFDGNVSAKSQVEFAGMVYTVT